MDFKMTVTSDWYVKKISDKIVNYTRELEYVKMIKGKF